MGKEAKTKEKKRTKKKAAEPKKMGRPPKIIDKEEFEKLCAMQCTLLEICAWFNVQDDTLNTWCKKTYGTTFSEVFKQKRGIGKITLRRSGFRMAQTNPTVHIFYAKNFLGMTDKQEHEIKAISDETRDSVNELINKLKSDTGTSDTNTNADSE